MDDESYKKHASDYSAVVGFRLSYVWRCNLLRYVDPLACGSLDSRDMAQDPLSGLYLLYVTELS